MQSVVLYKLTACQTFHTRLWVIGRRRWRPLRQAWPSSHRHGHGVWPPLTWAPPLGHVTSAWLSAVPCTALHILSGTLKGQSSHKLLVQLCTSSQELGKVKVHTHSLYSSVPCTTAACWMGHTTNLLSLSTLNRTSTNGTVINKLKTMLSTMNLSLKVLIIWPFIYLRPARRICNHRHLSICLLGSLFLCLFVRLWTA